MRESNDAVGRTIKKYNIYKKQQNVSLFNGSYREVTLAWVVSTESKQDSAERWAGTQIQTPQGPVTVSCSVEREIDNEPIESIQILNIEVRGNGGRAYKVLWNGYCVDMREEEILDCIFNAQFETGGIIKGKFVWAINGTATTLMRVDSAKYKSIVLKEQRFLSKKGTKLVKITKPEQLSFGDIISNGQDAYSHRLYLGKVLANGHQLHLLSRCYEHSNYTSRDYLSLFDDEYFTNFLRKGKYYTYNTISSKYRNFKEVDDRVIESLKTGYMSILQNKINEKQSIFINEIEAFANKDYITNSWHCFDTYKLTSNSGQSRHSIGEYAKCVLSDSEIEKTHKIVVQQRKTQNYWYRINGQEDVEKTELENNKNYAKMVLDVSKYFDISGNLNITKL